MILLVSRMEIPRLTQKGTHLKMALLVAALASPASSVGETLNSTEIRVETSGFPLLASDRPSSASALSLRPNIEVQGDSFTGKLDLQFMAFLGDTKSFTFEGREVYVATNPGLLGKHQLSFGRRAYSWGSLDEKWNTGIYAPRFLWDPTQPETVGLNGFFYTFRHRRWSVTALASPISVPERGAPIIERDGRLVSANPFWQEPIRSMPVLNQSVPIHYKMVYPELRKLLLNPGAAVTAGYNVPVGESGPEGRVSYANQPIHQPLTAMETGLNPQTGIIEATLHPYVLRHQLLTTELGYRRPFGAIWGSVTREWTKAETLPAGWVARGVGPTWITSFGVDVLSPEKSRFSLSASYISILEASEDVADAALLPSRYQYERAGRLDFHWRASPRILADARLIHDFTFNEDQLSVDVMFRPSRLSWDGPPSGWMFGLGVDLFSTKTGTGWIGNFEGDDRVRGRVSYAF